MRLKRRKNAKKLALAKINIKLQNPATSRQELETEHAYSYTCNPVAQHGVHRTNESLKTRFVMRQCCSRVHQVRVRVRVLHHCNEVIALTRVVMDHRTSTGGTVLLTHCQHHVDLISLHNVSSLQSKSRVRDFETVTSSCSQRPD